MAIENLKSRLFVVGLYCGLLVGAYTAPAGLKIPDNAETGLKTDPELDVLLQRADQFAEKKRYDLASELWQKVIDDSNDSVMTKPEWVEESLNHQYRIYKPVQDEIEQTLSALPPDALKVYRLRADGEAVSVLASARNQNEYEIALGEVVRRYFLSSQGDDAAFELARLHLDRFEFLPALRLINKILRNYPDSGIPKAEMRQCLVVAHGYAGNSDEAAKALGELKNEPDLTLAPELLEWIEAGAGKREPVIVPGAANPSAWHMSFGNAERTGTSPDLELGAVTNGLKLAWKQGFVLTLPPELEGIIRQKEELEEKVPDLLEAWKMVDWMLTGQVLVNDGLLYFKKDDRLVCLNAASGDVEWMGFRNGFALDAATKQLQQYRSRGIRAGVPNESASWGPLDVSTIQNFSDHVAQSMIFADNKVITLEGRPLDLTAQEPDGVQARFSRSRGSPTRKRENWMVAYHAQNGKLKWYRTAGEKGAENESVACFLAAPVPYGAALYAPVLDQSSLWLYALDLQTGKTIWKKYLCDEEAGSVSRFSTPAIAVSGGEVYISTGAGLAFGMDAISGMLRWCVRYPRSVDPKRNSSWYYTQPRKLHGWSQDVVIPLGKQVLVLASDFDQLLSLNRNNGELMWESAKVPSRKGLDAVYALGTVDGQVVVAGRKVVRAYKMQGGRMLWETPVVSYGRGLLTPNAIYLPGATSLIELNIDDGKVRREVPVETVDNQPLGNLFTDGERVYSLGLRRVYCFEPER